MNNCDFNYFSGADLSYPSRPTRPRLNKNHTPDAARDYADQLEKFEKDFENYKEELDYYHSKKNSRLEEFKSLLRSDFVHITDGQFYILWNKAWEMGHSSGLNDVYHHFSELYDFASKYAAQEKG